MRYKVFGDYGYTSERLLYESEQRGRAISFAEDLADNGDFDGLNVIEVAYFAPDGEYVVERKYRAEDFNTDWNDRMERSYLYDEY
jgi:hypothetical protein